MAGSVPLLWRDPTMRRLPVVLLFLLAVPLAGAEDAVDPEPPASRKGEAIVFDGLSSRVPAYWEKEKVEVKFRHAQFRVPGKGKEKDAQLVIYKGIGGKAEDN